MELLVDADVVWVLDSQQEVTSEVLLLQLFVFVSGGPFFEGVEAVFLGDTYVLVFDFFMVLGDGEVALGKLLFVVFGLECLEPCVWGVVVEL